MLRMFSRSVRLLSSLRLPAVTMMKSCSEGCNIRPLLTRSYWMMTNVNSNFYCNKIHPEKCACGCASSALHTKGDKELVDFLNDEIKVEVKSQGSVKLPKVEGFEVKQNGSSLELTRHFNNQKIRVTVNVNHTVDAEIPDEAVDPSQDKVDLNEMKSRPAFVVEITKGLQTLAFSCSVVQDVNPEQQNDPEAYSDIFNIDEVSIFEGTRSETTYAVSGEIMDGYLYDLLMNYLEERGISNEFAEKLVEYCTTYEHKLYVGLLENLKSFASK